MIDETRATTATIGDPTEPAANEVDGLGIKYNLRFTKKTTMRGMFTNLGRSGERRDHEFWALRDVSFRIANGESLAVIGPNGAGKSTLLQALAGILMPSAGSIMVRGRISSLLTLGAGFDPELTGRENVRLAGAFGSQIDPFHALVLGLVPDAPLEQVSAAGNSAGTGALIALLSRDRKSTRLNSSH